VNAEGPRTPGGGRGKIPFYFYLGAVFKLRRGRLAGDSRLAVSQN
jgi:hypothetical protein